MKTNHVVIASIVLGAALGSGISWGYFHDSPALAVVAPAVGPRPVVTKGQPKVAVDSHFHDFRQVEHNVKVSHAFKLTNVGDRLLELEPGTTTCSRCTIATLEKNRLKPGESTRVTIEYTPTQSQPIFRQHASIKTNDPEQKLVELNIEGTVSSRFRVMPQVLVLSRFSAKESKSADLRILDFASDEMDVETCYFLHPETIDYFNAEVLPMETDELSENEAKSGCRVRVTAKPGLPVGPVRQTIRIAVKTPDRANPHSMDISIEGTVDSDISLVGRGWNAVRNRLSIGEVRSEQGAKRELYLMLRGPRRNDTIIKPTVVDPSWLKVRLGEPRELTSSEDGQGGVTQIPLTIEIPPGMPAVNHLGTNQGKFAEVVLETTNPDVKQIRMDLQFIILQ
jgi:hypothetical protein